MSKRDRHRKRKREIEEAEFNKLDQAPCRFPSNPDKMSLVWPGLCSRVKVPLFPPSFLQICSLIQLWTSSSTRMMGLIIWGNEDKQRKKTSHALKEELEMTPADKTLVEPVGQRQRS